MVGDLVGGGGGGCGLASPHLPCCSKCVCSFVRLFVVVAVVVVVVVFVLFFCLLFFFVFFCVCVCVFFGGGGGISSLCPLLKNPGSACLYCIATGIIFVTPYGSGPPYPMMNINSL